jgi:hypothetical protein
MCNPVYMYVYNNQDLDDVFLKVVPSAKKPSVANTASDKQAASVKKISSKGSSAVNYVKVIPSLFS